LNARQRTWLASITILLIPCALPAQKPAATGAAPAVPAAVQFVDVTGQVGVHFKHEASPTSQKYLPETMGAGVGLFDYDNDGRLDIFFVNGARIEDPMKPGAEPVKSGPQYWNRLYHQKADHTFEDVTEKAGVSGTGYGMGVAVGDYDNDGYEDLFVTALGHNTLYHNNGNGTFTDVTQSAGVGGEGWSTSATFVDYDGDGKLDLFVGRYLEWSFERNLYCGEKKAGYRAYCHPDVFSPIGSLLYRNLGGGRFADVSAESGIAEQHGKTLGVAIGDLDRDGQIDIFVANDSVGQFLFRNSGNGKFEETALEAGCSVDEAGRTYAGMGVDVSDYDNDLLPDVILTNLSNQRYAVYRTENDGTCSYSTNTSGIGTITLLQSGWGIRFFDYDNDGWKDLIVAQGHVLDTVELTTPHLRYMEPLLLARNNGHGFVDVSATSGDVFQHPWVGRGLAIGDIDNDGDLDAVVTLNNGLAHVVRNEGGNHAGHWLELRLVGHRSNRDGIGALITVTAGGHKQVYTVTTSSSYLSASDRRAHFGLGTDTTASIEVRWPSGRVQHMETVKADQMLTLTEPAETATAPAKPR
jgi:hypothetical protein